MTASVSRLEAHRAPAFEPSTAFAPVVQATTAFAVLLLRYTREDAIAIRLGDDDAPRVKLARAHDATLGELQCHVEAQLAGLAITRRQLDLHWASGDAALSVRVRLDAMQVDADASGERGLFATPSLGRVACHFRAAAREVARWPSTTVAGVRLLDAMERHRLLIDLARSEIAPQLAAPTPLHALFEARVAEGPDRIAVEHGAARVTYRELDARAERLAGALRARGIGPGDFVALLLPRSIEVYVAMLAVLKAGAAYVPLDPESPPDRIAYVLRDCGAAALLTASSLRPRAEAAPCAVIDLDDDREQAHQAASPPFALRRAGPGDACYVIYTSGSTGAPKGVVVEHRSAAHLVRAEQHLFGVRADDRVLQGFSVSFDAAVEEIWLAFAAGATLVVATKEAMLSDLASFLRDAGITVFSTVPTLLATIEGDLPGVRLLIVGGEACPASLADRFATGRRVMVNTYGPTEATVIATYARLRRGERVTIGRPLPNYRVYVLDAAGQLAPEGVAGEIAIGGIGVARGYVGAPERSEAKFVPDRFGGDPGALLYRTGDLGRFDARGAIEFLGRIDDQVKVRGFRVELGEIEAVLRACAGVAQATVALRETGPGAKDLVAYVVPRGAPSIDAIKASLRAKLPPYMVPARIATIDHLPTLASGKVDRRSLPPPPPASSSRPMVADTAPRGAIEIAIARCWCEILGASAIARDDDFFLELGGHSLLVARMVSRLRRDPRFAGLSVLDVYERPTIAQLAAPVASSAAARIERRPTPARATSRWAYYACGAAQLPGLYALFALHSIQWLAPYLAYAWLRDAGASGAAPLLAALGILFAVQPSMLVVALVAKWAILGRYRAGRYPLWSAYYVRFWLVERIFALTPLSLLAGTPLLAAYARLLGARVGRDAHLATDGLGCFDLLAIGDDAAIGPDVDLRGHAVEDGVLVVGPVRVGARASVGARSVLAPGSAIGDDASVGELSFVPSGVTVPRGEHWAGSPARHARRADASPVIRPSAARRGVATVAYVLGLASLPAFVVVALAPGLVALHALEDRVGAWSILASPLVAASFIVLLCLEIVAAKRLLVGTMKRGTHPLFSGFVVRRWLFDRAMAQTLDVVGGLYATLLLNPWLRALGVRLGPNAEVSTASIGAPDLVTIAEGAFVADCVSLAEPRVARGRMRFERARIGARSFVGNSAVVPPGAAIGDDCLVGCLSIAPRDPRAAIARGASWFGSPAVPLPAREASPAFAAARTYRPTPLRVAQRLAFELVRVTLPTTCFVALTCALIRAALALSARLPLAAFLGVFPLVVAAVGLTAAALVVALKWLVVGRYRAGEHPLWSGFVWRNELVTAMHENLADPLWNQMLQGTPFAAWFFRALGARIGRRVYMGTTELTEYDLVSVGDEASLDGDCTLQTHLFEDRVMKTSRVRIGARCTVGRDAIVLYDAHLEDGASLAPLSLVMKGETLPAGSRWQGSPARRVHRYAHCTRYPSDVGVQRERTS